MWTSEPHACGECLQGRGHQSAARGTSEPHACGGCLRSECEGQLSQLCGLSWFSQLLPLPKPAHGAYVSILLLGTGVPERMKLIWNQAAPTPNHLEASSLDLWAGLGLTTAGHLQAQQPSHCSMGRWRRWPAKPSGLYWDMVPHLLDQGTFCFTALQH